MGNPLAVTFTGLRFENPFLLSSLGLEVMLVAALLVWLLATALEGWLR